MSIEVTRTESATDAARILESDPKAFLLGGGTGLMRRIHEGDQSVRHLVRLQDGALKTITKHNGGLKIGAQVRMADILAEPMAAFLHTAAASVGAPALRNMASVAGNLFIQPPYGDLATAFLALEAKVEIATPDGIDTVPLENLLRDLNKRCVVTAVLIPDTREREVFFKKMTRSHPRGASIVTIAAAVRRSAGGISEARVAFGCLAERPYRDLGVERALTGITLSDSTIEAAVACIGDGITPYADALASGWYRQQMAAVNLRRILNELRT